MRIATKLAVLILLGARFPSSSSGQDLSRGVYWLVYDVKTHGPLLLCTQRSITDKCHKWDPSAEFFRTGTLIRLEVIHGKFHSLFNVAGKGVTLTDFVPQIRGVAPATAAGQPDSGKQSGAPAGAPPPLPTPPLATDFQQASNQVQLAYRKVDSEVTVLETYLGPVSIAVSPECTPRMSGAPTGSAGDLLNFASALDGDAAVCDQSPGKPFTNEPAFDNLTDRADRLIRSVAIFNASIPSKSAIDSQVALAAADLAAFNDLATRFVDSRTHFDNITNRQDYDRDVNAVKEDLRSDLGMRVNRILQASDAIAADIRQINSEMAKAFAYINALYEISESPEPFDVPLGQYSSGFAAQFTIYEVPQAVAYLVKPATLSQGAGGGEDAHPAAGQPAPIDNPFADPNQRSPSNPHPISLAMSPPTVYAGFTSPPANANAKAATPKPVQTSDTNQSAPSQGSVIYTSGNYDVHKFYQGDLVAGFFVSSLRSRQYGITNNGQSTSTTNLTYVTVVGPVSRPQYHAFVGLDLYPCQRDASPPGGVTKSDRAKARLIRACRSVLVPGLLVGYGVDALNNYLIGANWETPFGLNIGSGVHIGQETFLQPGIVPGLTQLPSGATAAPTFNKAEYGWYGTVSFDFNTMKTLIGNLFGGSGSKTGQ